MLHLRGVIPLLGGGFGEFMRKLAESLAVRLIGEEVLFGEEALVDCYGRGGGGTVYSGVEASEYLLEGFEGAGNKCSSRFRVLEGVCKVRVMKRDVPKIIFGLRAHIFW